MGEFWTLLPGESHRASHVTDVREAASAAHIYGKPLVAAESFTSFVPGWNDPPSALKWVGDHFMAMGVNRFVIHTSVHQPFRDRRPGLTLGPFGQHYTRNNTWAEQSKAWISLLTRSSYLLQQGLFVGDLAYYYGEGAPASVYAGTSTSASAGATSRLCLRLREHGGAADADVGEGGAAHASRRDELPGAGPAGQRRPAHPSRAPEAPRSRGRGCHRGRAEAERIAEPGRIPRIGRRDPGPGERGVGRVRRPDHHRARLRQGQGLLWPAAPGGAGGARDAARRRTHTAELRHHAGLDPSPTR